MRVLSEPLLFAVVPMIVVVLCVLAERLVKGVSQRLLHVVSGAAFGVMIPFGGMTLALLFSISAPVQEVERVAASPLGSVWATVVCAVVVAAYMDYTYRKQSMRDGVQSRRLTP
jgi:O-antigen/teichoic acid export membrane protein